MGYPYNRKITKHVLTGKGLGIIKVSIRQTVYPEIKHKGDFTMIINKGKGKGKERQIEWEFDVSGIPENPEQLQEAVESGKVTWKALHAFLVHSLPIKVRQAVSVEPTQEEVEETVQRILTGGSKRRNKAELQAELSKLTGLPPESFGGKVEDLERALEALKGKE